MDAPQLALPGFEPPPPTPTAASGQVGSWLHGLATLMRTVLCGPAMHDVLTVACTAAAGNRRGWHERVEDELAAILDIQETQAMVAAHTTPVAGFGQVRAVTWRRLEGDHAPADWEVTVEGTTRTITVPVNLKVHQKGRVVGEDRACAASALIRAARGQPLVGQRSTPDDVDAAALAWMAGRERIRGDYYLWIVSADVDTGEVAGVRTQGLLSTVTAGDGGLRLTVRRQGSRPDGAVWVPSDQLLPDGWDPNPAFARALLRQPSKVSAAVLALSLAAGDGANDAELAVLAGELLTQL